MSTASCLYCVQRATNIRVYTYCAKCILLFTCAFVHTLCRKLFLENMDSKSELSDHKCLSQKNMDSKSELSDDKCLVVQFINERKKPVQVGFQAWLKEEIKENADLNNLINSEVIIQWPKREDIKCARMMEKILKKKNVVWENLVVKVRSVGSRYSFYLYSIYYYSIFIVILIFNTTKIL